MHNEKQRAKQLNLLTQTSPDTLMGKLLRRFWQPIATASLLAAGTARNIRIMCEDLTLYRGESGTPYLIGGRCAHRCTVLHTGWVKDEQVRCMYHGWRYDGLGQCTEMPAEKHGKPELVSIAGYPVHEYSGLIFAYLGEAPAPPFELPRKVGLEQPGWDFTIREELWDCNWFQLVENSLDAVHLSFVHQWPIPSRLGEETGAGIPELAYTETLAGVRQTATRPNGHIRVSDWTFPNNNHIFAAPPRKGLPWSYAAPWHVPIDDDHSLSFTLYAHPGGEVGDEMRRAGIGANIGAPRYAKVLFEEHRLPNAVTGTDANALQDYAAIRGQGTIVDRGRERLGASDTGIPLMRRIFFRELEAIRVGAAGKAWENVEERFEIPTPA